MRVEYELSYVTCNQIDLMNIGMRLGEQIRLTYEAVARKTFRSVFILPSSKLVFRKEFFKFVSCMCEYL